MDNDISKQLAIANELHECMLDPVYFMLLYTKIQHPTKGIIDYHPYFYQRDVIYSYKNNKLNIVHTARQVGLTTSAAIYVLWYALFHRDKNILIASSKISHSITDIMTKIEIAYEYLPKWLKPSITQKLKRSMEFDNGSRIHIISSDACGLRARSVDLLWMDNFGHWTNRKQEEFYHTLLPHITNDSSVMITSSAVSSDGMFKNIFYDALNKRNNFVAHHISWNTPHGRGIGFKKDVIAKIGKACWEAEYECSAMIKEDHNGTRKEYKPQET